MGTMYMFTIKLKIQSIHKTIYNQLQMSPTDADKVLVNSCTVYDYFLFFIKFLITLFQLTLTIQCWVYKIYTAFSINKETAVKWTIHQ